MRLRDLGKTIGSMPVGPNNAITDVPGVRVGHSTIIEGDGALTPGKGPVRTGVTVIRCQIRVSSRRKSTPSGLLLFRDPSRTGHDQEGWNRIGSLPLVRNGYEPA